jgi:16S rRNA (cytidine1402-2'-O)-methyltransferase
MAELFVISTPIGNRQDITLRALKLLFSVKYLLCEDTRVTGGLIDHYRKEFKTTLESLDLDWQHKPQLIQFHEHNESSKLVDIYKILQNGSDVGLVSDAGTPLISDPGYKLVAFLRKKNFKVTTIPGPSACISAVSVSGLSADKIWFLGFLPRRRAKISKLFEEIKQITNGTTVTFYESAKRITDTLEVVQEVFGNIEVTLARELTKVHEEVLIKPIDEWLICEELKGELVVVFRIGKS